MADAMRFAVGERVAAYGWAGCRYRDGVVGTVIRCWVTGLGEPVFAVCLDAPQADGVCLVEAVSEDLVKLAATPAKAVRRPRQRRSRDA